MSPLCGARRRQSCPCTENSCEGYIALARLLKSSCSQMRRFFLSVCILCLYRQMCIETHANTHAHTNVRTYTCTYPHPHPYPPSHILTHSLSLSLSLSATHTQTHPYTLTHTWRDTSAQMLAKRDNKANSIFKAQRRSNCRTIMAISRADRGNTLIERDNVVYWQTKGKIKNDLQYTHIIQPPPNVLGR